MLLLLAWLQSELGGGGGRRLIKVRESMTLSWLLAHRVGEPLPAKTLF